MLLELRRCACDLVLRFWRTFATCFSDCVRPCPFLVVVTLQLQRNLHVVDAEIEDLQRSLRRAMEYVS